MKKVAFFPGSFDPFTKGHADIVMRGLKLFDEVIIGIGTNSAKKRYFPPTLVQLDECLTEAGAGTKNEGSGTFGSRIPL